MEDVSAPMRARNLQKTGTVYEVQSIPASLKLLRRISFPRKLGILEKLYGKSLSRKGICWVVASNHVLWKLDLRDVTQRWIVFGDYEGPVQMQWIKHWLNQGGVVIDSGANIGQMLLYLAPLPGVAIFAFEPLSETADWLEQCIENYPEWNAIVIRLGLSNRKENISIQIDGARSTTRMDWYVGKGLPASTIAVAPLDEFLEYSNIAKVRLWKLDVEGHELQALQGAEQHLRNHSIEAVLVEISDSSDATIEYLSNCGYSMYHIQRSGYLAPFSGISHVHGNVLALPGTNDKK